MVEEELLFGCVIATGSVFSGGVSTHKFLQKIKEIAQMFTCYKSIEIEISSLNCIKVLRTLKTFFNIVVYHKKRKKHGGYI